MRVELFIVGLILFVSCTSCAENQDHQVRANAKGPELFDFDNYQLVYSKNYADEAEQERRSHLFYARAFKVFVAGVKYLHHLAPSYLKINHLSDRTEQELFELMTGHRAPEAEIKVETHAVDEKQLDEELSEIVEHKDESLEKSMLAAELTGSRRKRRDTVSDQKLSLGDLIGKQVNQDVSQDIDHMSAEEAKEVDRETKEGEEYMAELVDSVDEAEPGSKQGMKSRETRVYIDLRETGCISPAKHQQECNACYVFSVMALYEYDYCMQHGEPTQFSEQYVLDCSRSEKKTEGCQGGLEWGTADFAEIYGLEFAKYYPYRGTNSSCPYDRESERDRMGNIRLVHGPILWTSLEEHLTAERLQKTFEEHGPLTVCFDMNRSMLEYGGGVAILESCINYHTGHAMTLVGHGIEDGLEYFLIRNSFGTDWGEDGYIKLGKRFNPSCMWRYGYLHADYSVNEVHDRQLLAARLSKL